MSKMSIHAFLQVARVLPKDISILIRGGTGIGKSQLVHQLANDWGFSKDQIIDRRLAQLSEGDVIGLPSTDGDVTRFNPPDWYKRACDTPMCLFLDEINRASPEVMQAAFQIVLDRELNGWKLHPETRVCSAVNTGSEYVVNEMDPALLRRFWTVDLDPTTKDWIKWAKDRGIKDIFIDFIELNEQFLRAGKNSNADDVNPTPASWERLNDSCVHCGIFNEFDEVTQPNGTLFRSICLGFVGVDATAKFIDYVKTVNTALTPDMVVNEYKSRRKEVLKKLSKERWASMIEGVGSYCRASTTTIDKKALENLKLFMTDAPVELRGAFMSKLSSPAKGEENIADNVLPKITMIWSELKDVFLKSYDIDLDEVEENKKQAQADQDKAAGKTSKPRAKKAAAKKK